MLEKNRLPNNNGLPTFYPYPASLQFHTMEIWRGKATKTSLLMDILERKSHWGIIMQVIFIISQLRKLQFPRIPQIQFN